MPTDLMTASTIVRPRRGRYRVVALTVALAAIALAGCRDGNADGPTSVRSSPATSGPTDRVSGPSPEPADRHPWGDFDEGVLIVQPLASSGAGDLVAWCVLVADTAAERSRGLMDAPGADLGGYDGMAFVWDRDTTGGFWMKDTEVALSIAYLDADGSVVSTADMDPCTDGDDCPGHPASGPYRLAVEVPQGALGDRQISDGALVHLERRSCPSA